MLKTTRTSRIMVIKLQVYCIIPMMVIIINVIRILLLLQLLLSIYCSPRQRHMPRAHI